MGTCPPSSDPANLLPLQGAGFCWGSHPPRLLGPAQCGGRGGAWNPCPPADPAGPGEPRILASDLYPDPDFVSLYPLTFLPSCQFRVVGPQHVKWPSVSSLDSALESTPALQSPADPIHLSPPASSPRPSRGHRRSASCGSPLSGGAEGASRGPGCGGGAPGPGASDCRIIRVQMELGEDGSVYKSILVRAVGWEVGVGMMS